MLRVPHLLVGGPGADDSSVNANVHTLPDANHRVSLAESGAPPRCSAVIPLLLRSLLRRRPTGAANIILVGGAVVERQRQGEEEVAAKRAGAETWSHGEGMK